MEILDHLINLCRKIFTEDEVNLIIKGYKYADEAHKGEKRKSGEPYIIHPVHVAYYVLTKHALYDAKAVCAALLHDTIEDTSVTWEDLVREFGVEIANLVLNVTNSSDVIYKDKNEKEVINNAMILRNMLADIRTIIIKSCDRIHNMETLEYKTPESRLRKARQTFCFYVPLDYDIGANMPARELEDLCFQYMNPEFYTHTFKLKRDFENNFGERLEEMFTGLNKALIGSGIPFSLNSHMQSYYGLYKGLKKYGKLSKIPGFITAYIVVDSKEDCYRILEHLKKYYFCEETLDDLECTNLDGYQAIKVVTKAFKKYRLTIEICTKEMELFNSYGYAALLNKNGNDIGEVHQIIKRDSSFFSTLCELGNYYRRNIDLITHASEELLGSNVRVVTDTGEIKILPKGSSVLDFAYFIHSDIGAAAYGALVNGNFVGVDYILKNNDVVNVRCDDRVIRTENDLNLVKTTRSRRRILEKLN